MLWRMDLYAYLSKHDGKPSLHGGELIRLARAVGRSPHYLYLAALGHKRYSVEVEAELCAASINAELTEVNRDKKTS